MLEFVVRARQGADPEALMAAVEAVRAARDAPAETRRQPAVAEPPVGYIAPRAFDRAEALERLTAALGARGFVYAPWEVAAYVAALRTKPFVLLAGVTGVGKSRLPVLVAESPGGRAPVVPVPPAGAAARRQHAHMLLRGGARAGGPARPATPRTTPASTRSSSTR